MRIVGVETWLEKMPLAEPYQIANQSIDTATNVFIRLETEGGLSGYGCAAPDVFLTGERAEKVLQALRDRAAPVVKGLDPMRRMRLLMLLRESGLDQQPSAVAAVDMALADLMGQAARQPLWKLLGGYRDRIRTSATVGILPLEEALARAADLVGRGFRCLKVKGGLDVEADVERVQEIRRRVGPGTELRFDANQGYTLAQALTFLQRTASVGLKIFEQPTPKEDLGQLGAVTKVSSVPVMADESLLTLADVRRLAQDGSADMINIKLTKVGGLNEALMIEGIARATGIEVMVGCMDESALGIAAGLALALARPTIKYADLDGHLDLIGDPFAGVVTIRDGALYGSDRPGLGVNPVRAKTTISRGAC